MIYIEGHWEEVNTLEDVARVIREYYNEELADKMYELIDQLVDAFNNKIEDLEDQIYTSDCDDWYDD
jgi:Mg2+ and Co2+ transporter CorA